MGTIHTHAHEPAMTIERFTARTDAFVFAAEQGDQSSLVFMEQGTAEVLRARARAELMCPEPGCSAPAITTVNRAPGGRRDGYRHARLPAGGAHAPESVMHRQAKALLQRWARALDGVATAEVEVPIAGGERIADVLLTSHAGNRLAIEVQYSDQPLSTLIERTESYRAAGITVTWLFGSVGSMSPLKRALRPSHKEILDNHQPLMWINPIEETIGWLAHASEPRPVTGDDHRNSELQFFGLQDLDLRATGLFPPGFLAMREAWKTATARAGAERAAEQRANAELVSRIRQRRLSQKTAEAETPGPRTEGVPNKPRCRACGLPLDPILEAVGVHFGDCTNAHW